MSPKWLLQACMGLDRLKSMLRQFYELFLAPPKVWRLPRKSEILIYDASGMDSLAPFLAGYSTEAIALRGESVNVPCLLRSVFSYSFLKGKPIQPYCDAIIRAVAPKVILTFIDNNAAFYTISNRFPDAKTILLQNGTRNNWLEAVPKNHCYHVDYMLVHNASIGEYYERFISGKAIPTGSLKNNSVGRSFDVVAGTVLFISQYRDKPKAGSPLYFEKSGAPIYFDQFYSAETQVLEVLDRWCAENKKRLLICGCLKGDSCEERDFFAKILKECNFEYLPKETQGGAYALVDMAEIVVFVDSTLGYESIARGKKTAAFSCRGVRLKDDSRQFGWPATFPESGPFWTNLEDPHEFRRVLNYLDKVTDEEWEMQRRNYAGKLMDFDPGNSRFSAILDQLLPRRATI
jgi:surface carbohydrate biosynthesis protein